ncbi:MAG: PLP-dependent aminotransferase family protein [Clostridiales bacterium]|jgi:DNA-binding transcriptional MocR family regulator|nr:PLP-dependent aminotransferase family protein [Clostridiales bacterium]
MSEILNIKLNKSSDIPIYRQLGDAIRLLAQDGFLSPSEKLPPIRTLAKALNINNITVINAYKYLESKRVIYSITGSGTYVTDLPVNSSPIPAFSYNFIEKPDIVTDEAINFAKSSASPDLFPVKEFQGFINEVLERDKGYAFSYQDIAGYEPLREVICEHLLKYGIRTSADRVQIINGAQQGIDLISKALLSHGDNLFAEKPTYYGAIGAFFSRGAQITEISLEKDGINLGELEANLKIYKPKFIYVMTYFQTPTGISYSLEKKRALLALAEKYNTYIIEEDDQGDFSYEDPPVVPLKALDYKNRVIYIKSFSKIMMPGLRLGIMVLPKAIHQKIRDAKYATDISSSGLTQRAFDLFLRSPLWSNRLAYMKTVFKARYSVLASALQKHLPPNAAYNLPGGGCSVWINLKETNISDLCNKLLQRNVLVAPGAVYSLSGQEIPFIRISFAAANEREIKTGVEILGDELAK